MGNDKRLDILKGALLLEHKGKALYESVTKSAEVEGVREIFNMLVKEEEKHIRILNKQYSSLLKGEDIDSSTLEREGHTAASDILSSDIAREVFGAGYEAAVVSAALEFEKRAVAYYSENAGEAGSEDEAKLYGWLADWEKTHMMMLARLDDEIKQQIWYDNRFWPLD